MGVLNKLRSNTVLAKPLEPKKVLENLYIDPLLNSALDAGGYCILKLTSEIS